MREETATGRLFSAGARTCVLSVALPTSLPIPLYATTPGLDLMTWAFAGLDPEDVRGPRALLVLAARDERAAASSGEGAVIGIATHYRDLAVHVEPVAPLAELPADDRTVLARALLSAASPATVAALADLAGLFEGPAIEPAGDAPEIVVTDGTCRVPGSRVPDYLLLRGGPGWACLRVARARLAFAPEPETALSLEPVWGPSVHGPDAAILLWTHRFVPVRIGAAR